MRRKLEARVWEKKDTFRCRFCGGHQCKRCGPTAYLLCEHCALEKLHSNWITEDILAMARPTDLSDELLDDMKRKNISAVFNLTMPGEHPFCGQTNGLHPISGFTYDPELLMSRGIGHYNYHWPDMTIPTMNQALQIVQIAAAEIDRRGKVAVHCHAGFGRTGLIIGCILIAKMGITAEEAIALIRQKRPGSVQTSAQVEFVCSFERYYAQLLCVYDMPDMYSSSNLAVIRLCTKTITQCVNDQEHTLPASERRDLRWIHKVVDITCKILLHCLQKNFCIACAVITGSNTSISKPMHNKGDSADQGGLLQSLKKEANKGHWEQWNVLLAQAEAISRADLASPSAARECAQLSSDEMVFTAHQLLQDWFSDRSEPLFRPNIISLFAAVLGNFSLPSIAAAVPEASDHLSAKGHFIDHADGEGAEFLRLADGIIPTSLTR